MRLRSAEKEITQVDFPIDVMYPIHKALRVQAVEADKLVYDYKWGESLQHFRSAFNEWVSVLAYHALTEDVVMFPALKSTAHVKDSEESHRQLESGIMEVQKCLDEEIGRTSLLIPRTRRHLYMNIVSLHIAQNDHLEEEEEFILPIVREELSTSQQLEIARNLLVDNESDDPRWIMNWLSEYLSLGEMKLLDDIIA